MKALLAAVSSTVVPIHQSSLLKSIRTSYNVFLLSRNSTNQTIAQGTLTQMIHHVFGRIDVNNINLLKKKKKIKNGTKTINGNKDERNEKDSKEDGSNGKEKSNGLELEHRISFDKQETCDFDDQCSEEQNNNNSNNNYSNNDNNDNNNNNKNNDNNRDNDSVDKNNNNDIDDDNIDHNRQGSSDQTSSVPEERTNKEVITPIKLKAMDALEFGQWNDIHNSGGEIINSVEQEIEGFKGSEDVPSEKKMTLYVLDRRIIIFMHILYNSYIFFWYIY